MPQLPTLPCWACSAQVYIPEANWLLLIGAIVVVGVFQTSAKISNGAAGPARLGRAGLAARPLQAPTGWAGLGRAGLAARPLLTHHPSPRCAAYGLAVVTVMLLDTSLLALVMVTAWEWSPVAVFAFWLPYTVITGAFFSSNVQKVPKGAWFSLALAAVLSLIAFIWWVQGCARGGGWCEGPQGQPAPPPPRPPHHRRHWGQHAKLRLVRDRRMLLRDLFLEEAPGKDGTCAPGGWKGGRRPSRRAVGMVCACAPGQRRAMSPRLTAAPPRPALAGFKGLGRASATSTTTVSTEKSGGGREGAHALRLARSGRPVARLPGVCIYFNELLIGGWGGGLQLPAAEPLAAACGAPTAADRRPLMPRRSRPAALPCCLCASEQACRPCWSGLSSWCPRCTRLWSSSQVRAAGRRGCAGPWVSLPARRHGCNS